MRSIDPDEIEKFITLIPYGCVVRADDLGTFLFNRHEPGAFTGPAGPRGYPRWFGFDAPYRGAHGLTVEATVLFRVPTNFHRVILMGGTYAAERFTSMRNGGWEEMFASDEYDSVPPKLRAEGLRELGATELDQKKLLLAESVPFGERQLSPMYYPEDPWLDFWSILNLARRV
jgi:hypothetical protein